MSTYIVIFQFNAEISVKNRLSEYPNLGISIEYLGNNLKSISHSFPAPAGLTHEQRLELSQLSLSLFWELLEYQYGFPIKPSSLNSYIVDDLGPVTGTSQTQADAQLVKEVVLPKEDMLINNSPRLGAWLRFANDARNSPSDAEAIRLYYAIWEDLKGRPNNNHSQRAINLKHIRDFVSHGEALTGTALLGFIQAKLGSGVNQFEPTNSQHRQFVSNQRLQARVLIEAELDRIIL